MRPSPTGMFLQGYNKIVSLAAALFVLAAFNAWASDGILVKSGVDKDRISIDGTLIFTVAVGTDVQAAPEVKLPDLKEFEVLSSRRGFNFSAAGGRMRWTNSLSLVLKPKREGTFEIGPARVLYNGKEYTTQPIKIEVIKGAVPLEPNLPKVPKPPQKKKPSAAEEIII